MRISLIFNSIFINIMFLINNQSRIWKPEEQVYLKGIIINLIFFYTLSLGLWAMP